MDARSEKYLQVKPMITAAAWDLSRRYPNLTYEDALGDCNLQFAKRMDAYDPSLGALTTYTAQIMRAAKRNVQDRFCSERGLPRERRSSKPVDEAHMETCKAIDGARQCAQSRYEEYDLFETVGHDDPEYRLFLEARNWEQEDRDLLNALYMGTEKGIEATEASVARNFPAWRKGQAKARLSTLRSRVAEVCKCSR